MLIGTGMPVVVDCESPAIAFVRTGLSRDDAGRIDAAIDLRESGIATPLAVIPAPLRVPLTRLMPSGCGNPRAGNYLENPEPIPHPKESVYAVA
jgi:hypothetical protein